MLSFLSLLPSSPSRGDQQSNHLLYHVMNLLKTNTRGKSFELVVDLTQASSVNEPDVSAKGGRDMCELIVIGRWGGGYWGGRKI